MNYYDKKILEALSTEGAGPVGGQRGSVIPVGGGNMGRIIRGIYGREQISDMDEMEGEILWEKRTVRI